MRDVFARMFWAMMQRRAAKRYCRVSAEARSVVEAKVRVRLATEHPELSSEELDLLVAGLRRRLREIGAA